MCTSRTYAFVCYHHNLCVNSTKDRVSPIYLYCTMGSTVHCSSGLLNSLEIRISWEHEFYQNHAGSRQFFHETIRLWIEWNASHYTNDKITITLITKQFVIKTIAVPHKYSEQ